MGKAHSNAWRQVSRFFDLPANLRLKTICGRDPAKAAAAARTFGFKHEVEQLQAMGLGRGASLENAVGIENDAILNPEGLRMEREFVRHKALDAVGDLYTLGAPMIGRFETVRGGHALNNQLCCVLLATPAAWRMRTFAPQMAQAV